MAEEPYQHRTDIVSGIVPSKYPQARYFRAICSCGWMGVKMEKRKDAEYDADEHVRLT
jgi:hypothetical protein